MVGRLETLKNSKGQVIVVSVHDPQTWNEFIRRFLAECTENLMRKNIDYGKQSIVRRGKDHSINYVIDQLFSKLYRIENIFEKGTQVTNESLIDSIKDVIGYACILYSIEMDKFDLPTEIPTGDK
jgi:hypothetical protein